MIGKKLGKYRIIEHLGTGGMSEVYKAYQPGLDRYVAIKVLHSFLATEEDFLTRFRREAKVAAMLRHPNIVRVHDFDAEEKIYYMVMEFVDGLSLKTRLREMTEQDQTLSQKEIIRIVAAVANALDYAHQRGMVHRDIKPANIMFTQDNEVILMDFGIAKMVNVAGLTASGAMVGTPAYMAPEQGLGQAGDERADIYSLGVVLYQLLTGHLPFNAETPMGIVLKHINEPLTSPREINPDLPSGVETVVMRALAKRPEDRYQTAKNLANDLRQAIAGEPIELVEPIEQDETVISSTFATAVSARPRRQISQWEKATLPSAPVYPPTADSDGPSKRHRIFRLVALAALILASSVAALFATGRAEPLLTTFNAMFQQTATPTSEVQDTPTPTSDAVATQIAAAMATWNAQATHEATINFTPSPTPTPTPTSTPTPDLTATAEFACVLDLEMARDIPVRPSVLMPGQEFTKRWYVENTGTCVWPRGVEVIFLSGDELEVIEKSVVKRIEPGETTEVEIILKAPRSYDEYTSVWRLQDVERNSIGEKLEVVCRVGPTPTPRATASSSPTPTPKFTPTPSQALWMSKPGLGWCSGDKTKGRVEWGVGGGPSDEYHYFYSGVVPEFELGGPFNNISSFPHPETYFTLSGEFTWPVPDNCCPGDQGRYVSPEGYEIVWRKIFLSQESCP